jgi:hypothetical protein
MRELFRQLESTIPRLRLAASKKLRDFAKQSPAALYPDFDRFAALLTHENTILRWNAILSVAYLACADRDGKIEPLLDRYLAPISGPVMITAANTIKGAALIARAQPALAATIATAIMKVEKAKYATAECRNIAIGHAITALQSIGPSSAALRFAARHTDNPRPATARKATRWLASWESASKSRSRSL